MKTIGFLKIHDKDYIDSKELVDLIDENIQHQNLCKIIDYLESGYSFTALPVMLHDDEDIAMFGLVYQTDGEWIWPNYYSYYLKKYPHQKINCNFLQHIISKGYLTNDLTKEEIEKVDNYFQNNIW